MDIKQISESIEAVNKNLNELRETAEKSGGEVATFGKALGDTQEKIKKMEADMADAIGTIVELKRQGAIEAEVKAQADGSGRIVLTAEELVQKSAFMAYVKGAGLTPDQIKSLSTIGNPDGGYLTARDTSGRIIQMLHNMSPLRSYASIQTISTDSLEGLVDNDEVEVGWTGEKKTRPETNTPKVGKWMIPVHERFAKPKATQTFIDDAAVDAEAWLIRKIADKLSRQESEAFIIGDGVAKPFGIMSKSFVADPDASRAWGKVQYTKTGNATGFIAPTASAVPGDCLITLLTSLRPQYWAGAAWIMNRFTLAQIMQLKDAQGRYVWQPDFTAGPGGRLLGAAVDPSFDHMDNVGAGTFPVAFGNFKEAYQIVDRQQMRVLRDPYSSKPFVEFYTTARVGGDVINSEAYKVLKVSA